MKVNIQKLKNFTKRFIPVLTALVVLVCCISFPASALYSYEDFISNLEVDGENEIITVTLPIDKTLLQVWNSDWSVIAREHGSSISFSATELATYHFGIYPMYGDSLSVLDLPNGTLFSFSYSLHDSSGAYSTPHFQGEFTYFNSAGVELRNDTFSGPNQAITDIYAVSFSMDKPDGADNCTFALQILDFMPFRSEPVTLTVKEIKFEVSISALYRQHQLTGKTNKLLEEVNKQLAEQGKTMEDILNGTPEQNEQADKFQEDVSSAVGDLGSAGDAMNQVEKPTINVSDLIPSDVLLSDDYNIFASALGMFWESDILSTITLVLGGLMLISYVLFGEKG